MGILLDRLTEYSNSDFYPYHMPGHKRKPVGEMPADWTNRDITEIEGFDNLHDAQGILKELQERAAAAYGAEESFYLVNGSTCGILSAISAAVPFGGELLIARNCHKSVYHAAYLRQLVLDLKNTLKTIRAEDVLQHDTPYYRIDTNLVRCDYLSFLETGKPEFYGEYMSQYSWAEETCAMLQFKK